MSNPHENPPVVNQQPTPTPPLEVPKEGDKPPDLVPKNHVTGDTRTQSRTSKAATTALDILCCPIKCPVCAFDFCCHSLSICCGAQFKSDGSLDGLLIDEKNAPGCCTELASMCCPRFIINPQQTPEDRARPRRALQLAEKWFRGQEESKCVAAASVVACFPCCLAWAAFWRCGGCGLGYCVACCEHAKCC